MPIRNRCIVIAALVVAALAARVPASAQDTNLTIYNETSWAIRSVYLSPTDDDNWGHDRLGRYILKTGYHFQVSNLLCDRYDAKLIDEDHDVCVIKNIRVCGRNDEWHFTNALLLVCEADTRD
jgi:hypothetical protein